MRTPFRQTPTSRYRKLSDELRAAWPGWATLEMVAQFGPPIDRRWDRDDITLSRANGGNVDAAYALFAEDRCRSRGPNWPSQEETARAALPCVYQNLAGRVAAGPSGYHNHWGGPRAAQAEYGGDLGQTIQRGAPPPAY
jgi:hypothetical protein